MRVEIGCCLTNRVIRWTVRNFGPPLQLISFLLLASLQRYFAHPLDYCCTNDNASDVWINKETLLTLTGMWNIRWPFSAQEVHVSRISDKDVRFLISQYRNANMYSYPYKGSKGQMMRKRRNNQQRQSEAIDASIELGMKIKIMTNKKELLSHRFELGYFSCLT